MKPTKSVPIIITNDLESAKAFYMKLLGFELSFDSPGYVGLRHPNNQGIELGFMKPETGQPEFAGAGLFLGLEVAEVDVEYQNLVKAGASISEPPADRPWGDRAFMVSDPYGIVIYISTPIAPKPEYKQYYR